MLCVSGLIWRNMNIQTDAIKAIFNINVKIDNISLSYLF
jgi:hypothetical protein